VRTGLACISLTGRFPRLLWAKVRAMSERETEASDGSASTAEFRAFASDAGGDADRPWSMHAPGRKVILLAVAVVVLALVLAIIGFSIAGH
jgi:hypothetical protein